jgi:hypothetical protein
LANLKDWRGGLEVRIVIDRYRRAFVIRTSEAKPHWINKLLVSF